LRLVNHKKGGKFKTQVETPDKGRKDKYVVGVLEVEKRQLKK